MSEQIPALHEYDEPQKGVSWKELHEELCVYKKQASQAGYPMKKMSDWFTMGFGLVLGVGTGVVIVALSLYLLVKIITLFT